jgi:hypothetical protein
MMQYCAQCGAVAQNDAAFCYKCGARLAAEPQAEKIEAAPGPPSLPKGGLSIGAWIMIGLGVIVAIGLLAGPASRAPQSSGVPVGNAAMMPDVSPDMGNGGATAAASPGNWQYSTSRDEMRHADERVARVQSTNSLHFDFPYGEAFGQISVRQSPRFGFDIFLTIDNGQFVCHSFTGGRIAVKFDDEPIRNYPCNDAADGSPTILFMGNERDFLNRLRRAQHVVIEADFYQAGRQQLRFDVAGLHWNESAQPRPTR